MQVRRLQGQEVSTDAAFVAFLVVTTLMFGAWLWFIARQPVPTTRVTLPVEPIEITIERARLKALASKPGPDQTLPEAMVVLADALSGLREVAEGHRAQLLATGWSETMAEHAAGQWLIAASIGLLSGRSS